jgi:hypothetical protein
LCVIQLTSPFNADTLYETLPEELPVKEVPLPTRPSGAEAFPAVSLSAAQAPGAKAPSRAGSTTPANSAAGSAAAEPANPSADVSAAEFFGSK